MKKLLTLALICIGYAGMAQSKKTDALTTENWNKLPDSVKNRTSRTLTQSPAFGLGNLKPMGLFVWNGNDKPILVIDNPKNGWNNKIDSIIIHLNKQKLRWLNDSTAVITK